jgi:hypothetical protein
MKTIKLLLMSLMILGFSFSFYIEKGEAYDQEKKINIQTFPSSSFINVANMAPGDDVSSTFKMLSDTNQGIDVTLHSRLQSGFEPFYNQLQITASVENQVLYKGSLSKFQGYKILNVNQKGKDISLNVSLPKDSGNQFQDSKISVAFDFYGAVSLVNGNGSDLPDTATNIYNHIALGFILVFIGWLSFVYQRKMKSKKIM